MWWLIFWDPEVRLFLLTFLLSYSFLLFSVESQLFSFLTELMVSLIQYLKLGFALRVGMLMFSRNANSTKCKILTALYAVPMIQTI